MIKWSTLSYDNKTKKIHVDLEGVLYYDSADVSIKDLAERYIESDPNGDYNDWDLYHKLHQLIAKIISRDDVTIKQFKSTQLVYFEPNIGFLSREVLKDMIVEYIGERQDVIRAKQVMDDVKSGQEKVYSAADVAKELGLDH